MIKHTIRDKRGGTKEVSLTFKTSILRFCEECMGWQEAEVRRCSCQLCPLFPFRCRSARVKDAHKDVSIGARNRSDHLKAWRQRVKTAKD